MFRLMHCFFRCHCADSGNEQEIIADQLKNDCLDHYNHRIKVIYKSIAEALSLGHYDPFYKLKNHEVNEAYFIQLINTITKKYFEPSRKYFNSPRNNKYYNRKDKFLGERLLWVARSERLEEEYELARKIEHLVRLAHKSAVTCILLNNGNVLTTDKAIKKHQYPMFADHKSGHRRQSTLWTLLWRLKQWLLNQHEQPNTTSNQASLNTDTVNVI